MKCNYLDTEAKNIYVNNKMFDDACAIVAHNIKYYRNKRNLTLAELGELSGLSASGIGNFERMKTSPTIEQLTRLSAGLNININDIIGYRIYSNKDLIELFMILKCACNIDYELNDKNQIVINLNNSDLYNEVIQSNIINQNESHDELIKSIKNHNQLKDYVKLIK